MFLESLICFASISTSSFFANFENSADAISRKDVNLSTLCLIISMLFFISRIFWLVSSLCSTRFSPIRRSRFLRMRYFSSRFCASDEELKFENCSPCWTSILFQGLDSLKLL